MSNQCIVQSICPKPINNTDSCKEKIADKNSLFAVLNSGTTEWELSKFLDSPTKMDRGIFSFSEGTKMAMLKLVTLLNADEIYDSPKKTKEFETLVNKLFISELDKCDIRMISKYFILSVPENFSDVITYLTNKGVNTEADEKVYQALAGVAYFTCPEKSYTNLQEEPECDIYNNGFELPEEAIDQMIDSMLYGTKAIEGKLSKVLAFWSEKSPDCLDEAQINKLITGIAEDNIAYTHLYAKVLVALAGSDSGALGEDQVERLKAIALNTQTPPEKSVAILNIINKIEFDCVFERQLLAAGKVIPCPPKTVYVYKVDSNNEYDAYDSSFVVGGNAKAKANVVSIGSDAKAKADAVSIGGNADAAAKAVSFGGNSSATANAFSTGGAAHAKATAVSFGGGNATTNATSKSTSYGVSTNTLNPVENHKISGIQETITKSVSPFSGIVVKGNINIIIEQGNDKSAQITGNKVVMNNLHTKVVNNILYISPNKSINNAKASIKITNSKYERIESSGNGNILAINQITGKQLHIILSNSGNIEATIQYEDLHASISGSGTLDLSGTADSATFSISGSADIEADELILKNATVSISGSGDCDIHVTDSLDAQISGSGDLCYSGNPQVSSSVSGSGDITKD